MWNQFNTADYEGMIAETITISGYNGDRINAYFARPLGSGPYPSIVLVHHLPGWDELYREIARRFAHQGYAVCSPDLFARFGQGTPDDIASAARGQGGVSDDSVLADTEGAAAFLNSLPYTNGKVGIIGSCSGGRHSVMVACRSESFDAVVDLWGGRVVMAPDTLTPQQPVAPIDLTPGLSIPMLGIFGNDDAAPSPEEVDQHEEVAQGQRQRLRVPPLRRRGTRLLVLRPRDLPPRAGYGLLGKGPGLLRRQAGVGRALSALRVQPSWLYPQSQQHTKG